MKHFRYSAVPDEAFFHTILANRPGDHLFLQRPLIATNWESQPAPYCFQTSEDVALLRKAENLLARKFTADSQPVIDAIKMEIWPKFDR